MKLVKALTLALSEKKKIIKFVKKFFLAVIYKFKDGFQSSSLSPNYCISQQNTKVQNELMQV
jgi:hypothetical protein